MFVGCNYSSLSLVTATCKQTLILYYLDNKHFIQSQEYGDNISTYNTWQSYEAVPYFKLRERVLYLVEGK